MATGPGDYDAVGHGSGAFKRQIAPPISRRLRYSGHAPLFDLPKLLCCQLSNRRGLRNLIAHVLGFEGHSLFICTERRKTNADLIRQPGQSLEILPDYFYFLR